MPKHLGVRGMQRCFSPQHRQLHDLNNCINRAVHKIFGVSSAVCVRRFVCLYDVSELVEKRRLKFMDSLIDSGRYADLFLANSH